MKTNPDKHLEGIVDKLMKETSLEKPSVDFTANVMLQVYATETGRATLYKPLISKKGWIIIFGAIILLMFYLSISGNTPTGNWLNLINITEINNRMINSVTGFKFSAISKYAVVLSTIMLFIQITFLKRFFDKRFES